MSSHLQDPLPLTVFAGYLGAGKTTALNKLLEEAKGRRIMVLVNDFGDIAIDEELIATRDGDTISLSNGCVCCAVGSDLFRAFALALDARPRPDHLVIEASGVAEPDRIANFARAEPELRLDGIIVFVDAVNAREQAQNPLVGETLMRQFKSAGILVITKQDLVEEEELPKLGDWLREISPDTPIVTGLPGMDVLLGSAPFPAKIGHVDQEHSHEQIYERWSMSCDRALSKNELAAILDDLPSGILRLKGVSNGRDGAFAFHTAGRHRDLHSTETAGKTGLRVVAISLKDQLPVKELNALFDQTGKSKRKAS